MTAPLVRIPVVLLLVGASWAVWNRGGAVLEWAGLDDLDAVGRLVLVFAFLSACEAALGRLLARLHGTPPDTH